MRLLDATEQVMCEAGYASVTAARVAKKLGLGQPLIYYYFKSIDDLLVAAYQRRTTRLIGQLEQALSLERPMHALWRLYNDPADAALTMEYMALANHNPRIRRETVKFGTVARKTEFAALARLRHSLPIDAAIAPPYVITIVIESISRVLALEAGLGLSGGHAETRAFIEWCLSKIEPD